MYVIARTAKGRPTLMHLLSSDNKTACGLDMSLWSRSYHHIAFDQILCKKCKGHI